MVSMVSCRKTASVILLFGWAVFWTDTALACWTMHVPAGNGMAIEHAALQSIHDRADGAPADPSPLHQGPHCVSTIAAPAASNLWPLVGTKVGPTAYFPHILPAPSARNTSDHLRLNDRLSLPSLSDLRLRL